VVVARIVFVLLCALLIANCAGQVDLAKYALAEQNFPKHLTSTKRQFAKTGAEYDAAQERNEIAPHEEILSSGPDVPKQNIGRPTAGDIGLSRKDIHEARIVRDAEKSDPGIVRRTVGAAIAVVQPAGSSPEVGPSRFLETLAREDKENRDLKLKTVICRGC
jgi:hypothetical protein